MVSLHCLTQPSSQQPPKLTESLAGGLTPQQNAPGQQNLRAPAHTLSLPKNRSTGNLLAHPQKHADKARIRFSFDAGSIMEYDPTARPPLMAEHEHGLGSSGLRRIRQQPLSRAPTLPSSPDSSFIDTSPARSSSMTLSIPPTKGGLTVNSSGPASPTLNFSEDLSRFPSESLHSFSFAHQTEDLLHDRQNILKKSIDFMRDRLGWAARNPGVISAQAKVSGDAELQSIMELLARADLLGHGQGETYGSGAVNGPLTGPADVEGINVFEKSFVPRSESPEGIDPISPSQAEIVNTPVNKIDESPAHQKASTSIAPEAQAQAEVSSRKNVDTTQPVTRAPSLPTARMSLKRTYTDTLPLSVRNKLIETLARPYAAGDTTSSNRTLPPASLLASGHFLPRGSTAQGPVAHTHRWAPAAQAIFTTEAHAPWTILAANDLACLVFGVTNAEVRKLGILEVVREDRRAWLEERLRAPGSDAAAKPRHPGCPTQNSATPTGRGITAQLLSKPSSRQIFSRRAHTDDGSGSSFDNRRGTKASLNHTPSKSRGVLLCGDVVPIQKRNGVTGSASLWVKEKRGGLIWVLEEISEDIAYLQVDQEDKVVEATGAVEPIWGENWVKPGMGVRELIPRLPRRGNANGYVDWTKLKDIQLFTARSHGGANIPATITQGDGSYNLRVSSFPHIAGMMVLSAATLEIISSNPVFSAALFGQATPDGLPINDFVPDFDRILHVLTEEDKVHLVDGIVIPEHSFRRARALLALREGKPDAAAIFLCPTGLPARHRDGSNINVDVQMRVVKSETFVPDENVIDEASEGEDDSIGETSGIATSEVVYALWITYSRHLHVAGSTGGVVSPLISRPGTPPYLNSPGQAASSVTPKVMDSDDSSSEDSGSASLTQQIKEAASQPISAVSVPKPTFESKSAPVVQRAVAPPLKKTIADFVILEEMGQGAYGQVKLVRYKRNNPKKMVLKYVTKKRILVDTWTRDRRLGTVPLEIHVLDYLRRDGLRHPNIVEMSDFFEDDLNYYIEMIPHGLPGMDLFDYIEMRSTMEEAECRNIFRQVVAAVHHLHTKAMVVHRDIKDENVILDGEGEIKLIDFGSAAYIKNGPFEVFVGTIGKIQRLLA